MTDIIEQYKKVVIQIGTPYSTGTGFYLKKPNLIITNEHVVRDNKEVLIEGSGVPRQMVKVLFFDPKYDTAFLGAPQNAELPEIKLGENAAIREGDKVMAIGHPLGLNFTATQGIVSNTSQIENGIRYIQHDASLNPGNSGGPLINSKGEVIGINTYIISEGENLGFSLPAQYLSETLDEYLKNRNGKTGARCQVCSNLIFEDQLTDGHCPVCGSEITLPGMLEDYQPTGIAKTIENILDKCGHAVQLSRQGTNYWEISQGSAKIQITYHEQTGLICGDALLCSLPKKNIKPLYEFILRQNYTLQGMGFSIREQDIVLSLLILDLHLNEETGITLFRRLFEQADYFDNILIEKYGALSQR
jgi:serine protease Do